MEVPITRDSIYFELASLIGLVITVGLWLWLPYARDPFVAREPSLLSKQAHAAYDRRDYAKAERCWRADLACIKREKTDITNDVGYFVSATWLGSLLEDQGRYPEAESLMTQALEISKKIGCPEYRLVPLSMGRLACVYRQEGRIH